MRKYEVILKNTMIRKEGNEIIAIFPPFFTKFREEELIGFLRKNINVEDINFENTHKIIVKADKNPKDFILYFIDAMFKSRMMNIITKREAIYIDETLELPLIGSHYFGLIDRGTNLIQIRPITGCNMKCIYCSVSEGPGFERLRDYVVDYEYLLKEYDKLVDFKGRKNIEAHIDGQGEPTLYPWIVDLVQGLSDIEGTEIISMQTNGYRLNDKLIEDLEAAGLTRINLSVDSLRDEKIRLINRTPVSASRIKKIIEAIVSSKIRLLVAPLWLPGINDEDIVEIIEYVLSLKPKSEWPIFGIQKYIPYAMGRKPKVNVMSFFEFYQKLRELEQKYNVKLVLSPKDFGIHKRRSLPKVFELYEVTKIKTVLPGRFSGEVIGVAKGRMVEITEYYGSLGKVVKAKILRNKDNIYVARAL